MDGHAAEPVGAGDQQQQQEQQEQVGWQGELAGTAHMTASMMRPANRHGQMHSHSKRA
jgi:hypothetical protein